MRVAGILGMFSERLGCWELSSNREGEAIGLDQGVIEPDVGWTGSPGVTETQEMSF